MREGRMEVGGRRVGDEGGKDGGVREEMEKRDGGKWDRMMGSGGWSGRVCLGERKIGGNGWSGVWG